MSLEECQLCYKKATPWFHINGHICDDCLHKNTWISVEKYLPAFHERVLIHINAEDCPDIAVGYMEHDGNFYFNEMKESIDCEVVEHITHWMPLPEPPKCE